jgi:hypothetical protein
LGNSSNRPPPQSVGAPCRIGVLERNRSVAVRVARVLRAASGLSEVVAESDPATLRSMLGEDPILLVCDASDLDVALEWAESRYPTMSVISWSSGSMDPLLEAAQKSRRLAACVGWPSFASMPRPWELALATRRLVQAEPSVPRLGEIFSWGATAVKFRPKTTGDRDAVVAESSSLAERAGAPSRTAQRVGEVAHEMLMNAMYDAPIDEAGNERYAHDRKRDLDLDDRDAPTFRFATDGIHVALQAIDRFGRLERRHVIDGILRGRRASSAESQLDTSGGGAGLGMSRIYSNSTVMLVDVEPRRYTSVTTFFDLDVNPREARSLPVSLHLFGTH